MLRIIPQVPEGCQVYGKIYWDEKDSRALGEDMVDVQLPNGLLVSCGWYPEGSPDGHYRVTVSEGFHEIHRTECDDPYCAAFLTSQFAVLFSGQSFYLADSQSSRIEANPRGNAWGMGMSEILVESSGGRYGIQRGSQRDFVVA